jgi:hypothetical protein
MSCAVMDASLNACSVLLRPFFTSFVYIGRTMNRRPLSVTVISVIFFAAGVVGLAYHAMEFKTHGPFRYDVLWVCFVRLLAVIGAVFMFRAHNWARWLLVVWLAYHVVLSAFHSPSQFIMHGLLLGIIAYFLFRRPASAYFRAASANPDSVVR